MWISFSTLHFAFNYLRSLLLGLHFINADSTESVNCSRFPLLAGGTVDFAQQDQHIVLAVSSSRNADDFATLWSDVLDFLAWYLCLHHDCICTDNAHPLHQVAPSLRRLLGATWSQGSPTALASHYLRRRLAGDVRFSMSDGASEVQHGSHRVHWRVTSLNCNAHHVVKGYSASGGLHKTLVAVATDTATASQQREAIAKQMRREMFEISRLSHTLLWAVSLALELHYRRWEPTQPAYIAHHRREYGPDAPRWQSHWSRAHTPAAVPNHNNGRESGFARFKQEVLNVGPPCTVPCMIDSSLRWLGPKSAERAHVARWVTVPCCSNSAEQTELWRQALNMVREDGLFADLFAVLAISEADALVIPSRATVDLATQSAQRLKARRLRERGLRVPHIGSITVTTQELMIALRPMHTAWQRLTFDAAACREELRRDGRSATPRLQAPLQFVSALRRFHTLNKLPAAERRGYVWWSCTCPLYGERGVCPHALAAALHVDEESYTSTFLSDDVSHSSLHQRRAPGRPSGGGGVGR